MHTYVDGTTRGGEIPNLAAVLAALGYLPLFVVCRYVVLGFFFTVVFDTNLPVFALLFTFGICSHPLSDAPYQVEGISQFFYAAWR